MRAAFLLSLVALVGQAACTAHAPVADQGKLNLRLEDLAQRESSLQKQVEEIQNRLFLLEDKVDVSRVAIERSGPPQLPVVRIRPPAEERQADAPPRGGVAGGPAAEGEPGDQASEEEPPGGRSVVARRGVVYEGEAGRRGPRPVLRLHESGGGGEARSSLTLSAPLPGPDLAGVNEKLPVVPLPKRGAAKHDEVQAMQEYQAAMSKYRAGDLSAAAEAFRSFFQHYGHHAYADNALYWLAECSYDLKHYQLALKFFRQVVEQYPNGNKAPDALLKLGYCYLQLSDRKNARTILGQVVESYPRSQVARLASAAMTKL